ncbi:unnamed protein product [Arctogadus glacialis]
MGLHCYCTGPTSWHYLDVGCGVAVAVPGWESGLRCSEEPLCFKAVKLRRQQPALRLDVYSGLCSQGGCVLWVDVYSGLCSQCGCVLWVDVYSGLCSQGGCVLWSDWPTMRVCSQGGCVLWSDWPTMRGGCVLWSDWPTMRVCSQCGCASKDRLKAEPQPTDLDEDGC